MQHVTEVHPCDVCTKNLFFLLLLCVPVYEQTTFYLPIYPLVDTCISIFTMMNNVVNICKHVLCGHMFSFFLGRCLGVELLGHVVSLCLLSKRLPNCSSKWLYHFTGSSFFMSSPTLGIVCSFAYGHFSGCVVASHLVLICVTLVSSDVKHLHMHMCAINTSSSVEVCSSLAWS